MRIRVSLLLAITLTFAGTLSAQQSGPPININRPPGPLRVSGKVMAGQLLNRVEPVYPDTNVQGTVILHAIIGSNGTVQELSVISGPPALARAAMDSVRLWIYQPYLVNGEPVTVDTSITVTFKH